MKSFQTCNIIDDLSCLDYSSTVNINNSWILLPIYHLTLMSFCTQDLPEVAESIIPRITSALRERGAVTDDR